MLWLLSSLWLASSVVSLKVVDVRQLPWAKKIPIQVCAGLLNRDTSVAGAAYVIFDGRDLEWLNDLESLTAPNTTPDDFLAQCTAAKKSSGAPLVSGYIRFDATSQQINVPDLFTLAGVLDALPTEDASAKPVVFDAVTQWANFSNYDSTKYMYENYIQKTTALCFMNPGLDVHANPVNPPLTKQPSVAIGDYVVKAKLFNFFMNDACIPGTKEHRLMADMTSHNSWAKPTAVYGYNDAWPIGGDLYEAETDCNRQHNLGQVATAGVSNLAYLSNKPPITKPLKQNPTPAMTYNASKTYISFMMGDGDNVGYLRGGRRDWFLQRVESCKKDPTTCFPLLWSISPHVLYLAPDWAEWYYNHSYMTKSDFFALPPSGHLYAYPSMMDKTTQAAFVEATENDAKLLSTNTVTTWDFVGTWYRSLNEFLPMYSANGVVTGFFPVNVPYFAPIPEFISKDFFKVLGEKQNLVAFKPREWRGVKAPNILMKDFFQTSEEMADLLNGHPPGTVSAIYVTSDGGWNFDVLYNMHKLLDEHVELVDHNNLIAMALASHKLSTASE